MYRKANARELKTSLRGFPPAAVAQSGCPLHSAAAAPRFYIISRSRRVSASVVSPGRCRGQSSRLCQSLSSRKPNTSLLICWSFLFGNGVKVGQSHLDLEGWLVRQFTNSFLFVCFNHPASAPSNQPESPLQLPDVMLP